MFAGRHRLTLHALAAVTLSGIAVLATGSAGSAATPTRPGSYGGQSVASAVELRVDKDPGFVVSDPVHPSYPHAETSIDSSGDAGAIAASVYPGQGLLGVPALLCQFAPICGQVPPPDYPAVAQAQYPSQPDATAGSSPGPVTIGPLTVDPHGLRAHADPDRVSADAVTTGAGFTGIFAAESATATSRQEFKNGAIVLTAESVLHGIDIGGVVHIAALDSLATATIDGVGVHTSSAVTTISGAEVAGTPVSIDSTGIHIAGSGDGGAAAAAVNTALAALQSAGVTMKALDVTKSATTSNAAAMTGGILVTFHRSVDPANSDFSGYLTIGGAGVSAYAGAGFTLPTVAVPAGTTGAASTAAGSAPPPPPATTVSPAGGPAPAVAALPSRPTAGVLGPDSSYKRLRTLMLVLLAYPLLVLLGAPLRLPARLPRSA